MLAVRATICHAKLMTQVDREPLTQHDKILNEESVIKFRDEIIVPVVDYLWGENFRKEAKIGEQLTFSKKVVDPETGEQTRVTVKAECCEDISEDDKQLRTCGFNIIVGQSRDDLMDGLVKTALASAEDLERYILTCNDNGLDAWKDKEYLFVCGGMEDVDPVYINESHALLDEDGDVFWCDLDDLPDESYERVSSENEDEVTLDDNLVLNELGRQLVCSMTEADRRLIVDGFKKIGVLE